MERELPNICAMATPHRLRIAIIVDRDVAGDALERTMSEWRAWLSELGWEIELALLLVGERAGFVERFDDASAAVRGVRRGPKPALAAALTLLAGAGTPGIDGLAVLLEGEPSAGWEGPLALLNVPVRMVVTAPSSPAAAGVGALGAVFQLRHLSLALRWLACEVRDQVWVCACGHHRTVQDANVAACQCGLASRPERLRVNASADQSQPRTLAWQPRSALFPHHLGLPLAFSAPLLVFGTEPHTVPGLEHRPADAPDPVALPQRDAFRAPALRGAPSRCSECAASIGPGARHRAPDPRWFCAACVAAPFRCDFCGVPAGASGGNRWPDGRKACRSCWTTAVTDQRQLEDLVTRARAWLIRRMAMPTPDCQLRLEHAAAIARLHGLEFCAADAMSPRPLGMFVREGSLGPRPVVFIEHATPLAMAWGVVVHELVHSWQMGNWPRKRSDGSEVPRVLVEGLAMWVEYVALLDAGAIHAAQLSERYGDPVYGAGFRLALSVEERHGFDAVKERILDG